MKSLAWHLAPSKPAVSLLRRPLRSLGLRCTQHRPPTAVSPLATGRRCGTTVQAVSTGGTHSTGERILQPEQRNWSVAERLGFPSHSRVALTVSTDRKRPRVGKAEATAGMGSQESPEAEKSDPAGTFRAPSHCPILDIFLKVMGGRKGVLFKMSLAPSGAVSLGHVSLTCWTETSWRSELRNSQTWRTWIR